MYFYLCVYLDKIILDIHLTHTDSCLHSTNDMQYRRIPYKFQIVFMINKKNCRKNKVDIL